ncbi:MAG: T9SS type B sorting domain-containing protein [Weeksellaceae bacterium]
MKPANIEIVSYQLILNELPFVDLLDYEICPDSFHLMDAGSGFSSYQWHGLQGSDLNQPLDQQTVEISVPGQYSVTVTNEENCEFEDFFTISYSEIPTIHEIVISGDGTATIHANGTPVFEYSLDGIFWQSSNVFHGLIPGDYSVYVRDGKGCISLKENFGVLAIPNFISPNKDGINDTWVIRGISNYPDVNIRIFDRYGKLFVDQLNHKNSEVWDGTYMGRAVKSGSYWYIIQLSDGRKYVGALAVKNY